MIFKQNLMVILSKNGAWVIVLSNWLKFEEFWIDPDLDWTFHDVLLGRNTPFGSAFEYQNKIFIELLDKLNVLLARPA